MSKSTQPSNKPIVVANHSLPSFTEAVEGMRPHSTVVLNGVNHTVYSVHYYPEREPEVSMTDGYGSVRKTVSDLYFSEEENQ